jgi:hypothetical protein
MDFEKELESILETDPLGLLDVKPKQSAVVTADERLISSFEEINQFVSNNGHEPIAGQGIQEHQLYARLKGIRESKEKVKILLPIDKNGLFQQEVKEIKSIDDVFDDDLDILDTDAENIFNLKHVDAHSRVEADYIARRTTCDDFSSYEQSFVKVQNELRDGTRKTREFRDKGESLKAGDYYILSGILLYLESVDITSPEKTINGKRFRKDGRTKCIFENGTESNMLYRSLAKQLLSDGRIVSQKNDKSSVNEHLYKNMSSITEEDDATGYIYVLSSQSTNPEIQSIKDLYKIGFSRVPVEERIKNAENEPTYLMASVSTVTVFQCYNMNPQKLEQLLHTFFGSACLDIDVFDKNGQRHTPREWFIAPLSIIEDAINLVLSGEIIHCKYDPHTEKIIAR